MVPWTVGKQRWRLAVRLVFIIVTFFGLPLAFLRYMQVGTFCFLDPWYGIQYWAVVAGFGLGHTATNAQSWWA